MFKYRLLFILSFEGGPSTIGHHCCGLRGSQIEGWESRALCPSAQQAKENPYFSEAAVPSSFPQRLGWLQGGGGIGLLPQVAQGKLIASVGAMDKTRPQNFGRWELRTPFYRASPADLGRRRKDRTPGPCPQLWGLRHSY